MKIITDSKTGKYVKFNPDNVVSEDDGIIHFGNDNGEIVRGFSIVELRGNQAEFKDAPKWGGFKWFAVNKDGTGMWYGAKPRLSKLMGVWLPSHADLVTAPAGDGYDASDWVNSLEHRDFRD